MTIQYASDLHLEFSENRNFIKINPLKPMGNILILAGDIVPFSIMNKHKDFFNYVSDNFEQTYWIPGNHEYYHFDLADKSGKYPIFGTGGLMGFANSYLYNKPSVLIGRKGTINKPQFKDTPFWTVDTLFYTELSNQVIPKWMYYRFWEIKRKMYNEASGVPSLSASTISNIKIHIPELKEQTKIANILSSADKEIEILNQQLEKLKEQKKGLMQVLLSGQIRVNIEN